MDRPEGCHRLYPFRSLRMQEANSLRERHCVPFSVLETHCSPNRRDRVGIVGIVVVQLSTVARVANANVVGVPGVRSPKQRKLQAPRSHVVCSLNCFIEKFCIISPIGFQHPLRVMCIVSILAQSESKCPMDSFSSSKRSSASCLHSTLIELARSSFALDKLASSQIVLAISHLSDLLKVLSCTRS